nr:helix-turn-helix transcriptional regulator [uncultured Roseateles sp.]
MWPTCSARELQVARRYGQGETHREIAAALGIAPATARNHLKNVYGKLGMSNKIGLLRLLS